MSLLNLKLPRYGTGLGILAARSLEAIRKENTSKKESRQNSVEGRRLMHFMLETKEGNT